MKSDESHDKSTFYKPECWNCIFHITNWFINCKKLETFNAVG